MRVDTILEATRLKALCNCDTVITGGTEPDNHGVSAEGVDHVDGFKVDIRADSMLDTTGNTYKIENDPTDFQYVGLRGGDQAPEYKDTKTGAILAYEASKGHWDITAP